jgi:predicted Zn-dependent peptidase
MKTDFEKSVLPSGITVLCEHLPAMHSVGVGWWFATGARFEPSDALLGGFHYIEHMLFKGTPRRTARGIAIEVENVGAQLNALTGKEIMCFYGRALAEDLPLILDVLADMVFNSTFEPDEFDREKQVILEEIKNRDDTPEDFIFDQYLEDRCGRGGLGHSVLGYEEGIAALTRDDLYNLYRKEFKPDRLILAVAGNLNGNSAERLASDAIARLGGLPENGAAPPPPSPAAPFHRDIRIYNRKIEQTHFVIGVPGIPFHHDDRYVIALLDVLLSGGMSSRLFQEVREKLGLVYDIQTGSECYRDAGFFTVSAATRPENLRQVLEVTARELEKVRSGDVRETELRRAKQQFRAGMAMSFESVTSRMMKIARSEVYFGRDLSDDEIMDEIQGVTLDDVQRAANSMLRPGAFAASLLGPFRKKADIAATTALIEETFNSEK